MGLHWKIEMYLDRWRYKWYEFKCLFRPQYWVRVRNTPRTGLDPNWTLEHAFFSVVCDFVERWPSAS